MATIVIYNNDINGALRSLKKEQQKEGVFSIVRGRKRFKNASEISEERLTEIIRRKIKDKIEKKVNEAYIGVDLSKQTPFIFKLEGNTFKVYNNGNVNVYNNKNKKVGSCTLDKADFDDILSFANQAKKEAVAE